MPSTALTFSSRAEHRAWLASQSALPKGFRVGTTRFDFMPKEAPKPAKMTLTLIALDRPTPDFAAMFTKNAFPGAPVIVGRRRLRTRARCDHHQQQDLQRVRARRCRNLRARVR